MPEKADNESQDDRLTYGKRKLQRRVSRKKNADNKRPENPGYGALPGLADSLVDIRFCETKPTAILAAGSDSLSPATAGLPAWPVGFAPYLFGSSSLWQNRRIGGQPPNPRSLPLGQTPAEWPKREGRAAEATWPSAVRLTPGRSGRTPAEPCPPRGASENTTRVRWRPAANHPWRRTGRARPVLEPDISIVE